MRLESAARNPRDIPFPLVFGALAILCAGAAAMVVAIPAGALPTPLLCPFQSLTGLPCLTCGGTRALAALAKGELPRALALNPLVAVTAMGICAAAAGSLWRRLTRRPALRCAFSRREENALRITVAAAIALHWTYLILWR